jgi:hypothetical protein
MSHPAFTSTLFHQKQVEPNNGQPDIYLTIVPSEGLQQDLSSVVYEKLWSYSTDSASDQ